MLINFILLSVLALLHVMFYDTGWYAQPLMLLVLMLLVLMRLVLVLLVLMLLVLMG